MRLGPIENAFHVLALSSCILDPRHSLTLSMPLSIQLFAIEIQADYLPFRQALYPRGGARNSRLSLTNDAHRATRYAHPNYT